MTSSPHQPPSPFRTIRIGHSPDPDDAFMWFPLTDRNTPPTAGCVAPPAAPSSPADPASAASTPEPEFDRSSPPYQPHIDTGPYRFVHILQDIESLNQRTQRGELEITALSIHQYAFVADRYALTSCGSSMGDAYGPIIVAGRELTLDQLRQSVIAVPGLRTTAFLALSLLLGKDRFRYRVVPFDQILPAVAAGQFDAGLLIHEGQLTYAQSGLRKIIDLGQWWSQRTGLPLPLGGNAIRRDLGPTVMRELCAILHRSIRYALDHRELAVQYALQFGRGLNTDLADRFVGMYVNQWTLDYGPRGRQAVQALLSQAAAAGLVPPQPPLDFVTPD